MKYLYTRKDIEAISWETTEEIIDKIYQNVEKFVTYNNLKIKYICPIIRGGCIPAVKLSYMFHVIDMLPIQLKHNFKTQSIDTKIGLDYVKESTINEDECILLVDGKHCTGRTANIAVKLIKEKFGPNTKIIYVTLSRDYVYKDTVKDIIYTTWGITTNETKQLDKDTCQKLNINYNKALIYPWENIEEELEALNSDW